MNLKEAFRFQNKLGTLMDEAQGILGREANITGVPRQRDARLYSRSRMMMI